MRAIRSLRQDVTGQAENGPDRTDNTSVRAMRELRRVVAATAEKYEWPEERHACAAMSTLKPPSRRCLPIFWPFLCLFPQDRRGGMQTATMEGSVVGGVRTSDDERRLELGLAGSDGTGSAGEGGNGSEALISQVPSR